MKSTEEKTPSPVVVTAAPLDFEEGTTTRRRLADNLPTTRVGRWKETLYYMRGRGALEISIIYALIVVVFIGMYIRNSTTFPFLSSSNLSGVLSQNIPILALLAIGAGILMIAGEFDLSIGASLGFSAIVFIRVAEHGSWPLAFVLAVGSAMGIALLNGLIVILTRIPSFIATLGMSFFWTGASIYLNGTTPAILSHGRTHTVLTIFAGNHGYFRSQLVWMLVIGVVMWFMIHRHRIGNHIYAVGGNAAAATAVSIRPKMVKLQAFAVFGFMVGIAAVLIAVRTADMQPGTTGDYTLFAIAAAVVGGCSLTGGRGTVVGMIVGAALVRTVENGLILGKAPGYYVQLFVGLTIVVAAVFNKLMEGRTT